MNIYYLPIGSFRNMIFESDWTPEAILDHINSLGWVGYKIILTRVIPMQLSDIPKFEDRNKEK